MKRCVNCGEKLPKNASYCGVCGTPVVSSQKTDDRVPSTHRSLPWWGGVLIAIGVIAVIITVWTQLQPRVVYVPTPSAPEAGQSQPAPAQPAPTQIIRATMNPGAVTQVPSNPAKYAARLTAGQTVRGSMRLTGYYISYDWSHEVSLKVFDPRTGIAYTWSGTFGEGGAYCEFAFTAPYDGEYILQVQHWSFGTRDLSIEIQPSGWSRM